MRGQRTAEGGSRKWLQVLVNHRPDLLEEAVRSTVPVTEDIRWLSPLASDGFRMYRDVAFLDRLDVQLRHRPLQDFWPARGPRWGGLARCGANVLLVEAATHAQEFDTACQASSAASIRKIRRALAETQHFLGADTDADWASRYYQYANRLAHLYLLRELNGLDAFLVVVCFVNGSAGAPASRYE